ncbi:hypothetical protein [Streptomyces pratensis]|uniref:hypothetical protein n=1 Tax=Streptomyces pratensis TaxID=1169025 RepID=UPI003017869E
MHADIHHVLHSARSAELRRAAALPLPRTGLRARTDLRTRIGWALVEAGLRLVRSRTAKPPAAHTFHTA